MNSYEEKKTARIERYKDHAENAKERSSYLYSSGIKALNDIPFGQPILIGHHSEKSDRSYRTRANRKLDKSFEELKKADYWSNKAKSAESNKAISSDDPNASSKLLAKIEEATRNQEKMKEANKIFKSKKLDLNQKISALVKAGFKENTATEFITGDDGFPRFALMNNNANISRMKKRLKNIEQMFNDETKEIFINGIKIVDNVKANRVQIFFEGKPNEEIRTFLKRNGFRWSPSVGSWQRNRCRYAIDIAKEACAI